MTSVLAHIVNWQLVIAGIVIAVLATALAIVSSQSDMLESTVQDAAQQSKTEICEGDACPETESRKIPLEVANSPANIHANVRTSFNEDVTMPTIESNAFIHPFAVMIGSCHIGKMVAVSPTAVCRGDEGMPILIGDGSNVQDGVVIHALETIHDGRNIDDRRFSADGDRLQGNDQAFADGYAVFVGNNTSLAHGAMIHGPAWIGSNTFIGMEALIFNAKIGDNVAVGVSATVTGGVEIADGRFVPPGSIILEQSEADSLPERIGSPYETINSAVVEVNQQLAEGYDALELEEIFRYREIMMDEGMFETAMPHP